MARALSELTGKVFGRLTVICHNHVNSKWTCKCTCGKIKDVRASSLKCGATTSCGCVRKEQVALRNINKRIDLEGSKMYLLTYIGESDCSKGGNRIIKVQCECGTVKEIPASSYMSGKHKSCGCYHSMTSKITIEKKKKKRWS